MAAPLLLLAAGVALAASSPAKKPAGAFVAIKAAAKKPGRAGPPARAPVTTTEWSISARLTAYAGGGKPTTMTVDLPDDAKYSALVQAMEPRIGYKIRIRGKEYGRGLGPDGSAKVVEFVANAVSTAGKWAAPATSKNAIASAVAAGIEALTKVVGVYASLIKRARLRAWAKFRDGNRGRKSMRDGVKKANAKWFSADRATASDVGEEVGSWRYQASGPGTWPMIGEVTGSIAAPTLTAEKMAGGYMRLTVTSAELSYEGEVRYDVLIHSTAK